MKAVSLLTNKPLDIKAVYTMKIYENYVQCFKV